MQECRRSTSQDPKLTELLYCTGRTYPTSLLQRPSLDCFLHASTYKLT